MADAIRRAEYYYVTVNDQPGEALRILSKLKEAGVNLLNFTAFPVAGGKSQLDIIPENGEGLMKAARSAGVTLSPKKQCFYVSGKDRVGAVAEIFKKLADARVNAHAANATCAAGNFGMILWVKPDQMSAAAKALGL